jgi:hypothetical protein
LNSFKNGEFALIDYYDSIQIKREYKNLNLGLLKGIIKEYGCSLAIPLHYINRISLENIIINNPINYQDICKKCQRCDIKIAYKNEEFSTTNKQMLIKTLRDLKDAPLASKKYGIKYGLNCFTKQMIAPILFQAQVPGLREILWS